MNEEKKTFNVKDRRMFTAEGDVRRQAEDEARDERPANEPPPRSGEDADPDHATSGRDEAPEAKADLGPEGPVDFPNFLVSLAAQGMQALMDQPPRLREARAMVSILEMLEDKTRGRRTAEENDVLETLLYQLRMGYLERQRAGGA